MGTTCWKCAVGWEHCHGTVIRHWLGRAECTEDDCPGPELIMHAMVIDCDAVGCSCAQPIGSAAESAAWGASG